MAGVNPGRAPVYRALPAHPEQAHQPRNGSSNKDPWATSFGDLASFHLDKCLGAYPVDFAGSWTPPKYWDADDIALEMPEYPNIWTDGSREDFSSIGGFEVAGAGVYLLASELAFEGFDLGHGGGEW